LKRKRNLNDEHPAILLQFIFKPLIRCPVAEYFHARGDSDLAVSTWCMLDYSLAEMIGMKLVRSQMLAASDQPCGFRWFTAAEKL
jgi:hypothetical protein